MPRFNRTLPTFRLFYLAFLLLLLKPGTSAAEVTPDQVAVVANVNSKESVALAEHYIRARNIPSFQLFALDLPLEETMSRKDYEQRLVMPLRKALEEQRFSGRIRVIAVMFGVPLRVLSPVPGEDDKERSVEALQQKERATRALLSIYTAANNLENSEVSAPSPVSLNDRTILPQTASALEAAARRIQALEEDARRQSTAELAALAKEFGGLSALLQNLRPGSGDNEAKSREKLDRLKVQIQAAQQLLAGLEQTSSVENRRRAYALQERIFGAAGVFSKANQELQESSFKDADASVDSELSLLWWNRDEYNPSGRLPNPYYYKVKKDPDQPVKPLPILMVSRIDAPTYELAKDIIDRSLYAEENGLSGRAYIDARGIKLKRGNEFSVWDQNLRDFAWMLRRVTGYRVTLDDYPPLLQEAKDTALYAGWYQLRNYQDVFTFSPGAIGYHIASEEAVSLRDPQEKGWCKNMIERGITATVGAIAEPYLESFPMPRQFFGLLLTGRYTLVEGYYLTTPYLSWRMVLLGDPLYNPWRKKYEVPIKEVQLIGHDEIPFRDFPLPPSRYPSADPLKARAAIDRRHKEQAAAIDQFFRQTEQPVERTGPPKPKLP